MFITADTVHLIFNLIQKEYIYEEVLRKYFPKKDIRDEFYNEMWLYFFEHPDRIVEVWNKKQFKYYYIGLIKNQVLSNSSSWHLNFRKPQQSLMEHLPEDTEEYNYFQEEEEQEEKEKKKFKLRVIEEALQHFQKLDPKFKPSADIFRLYYYENMSIREIGKKFFDSPPTTIFEHLKEAEVLVKHYKNKYHKHFKT